MNNYHFSQIKINGQYTFVSQQNLTEYSQEELVGNSAYNMFNPRDLKQVTIAHAQLLEVGKTSAIYRLRTKKGYIWVRSYSERTPEFIITFTFKLTKFQYFLFKLGYYRDITNNL